MEEPTKRCPYCDELIRANAVKCRYCGSMIGGETALVSSDPITAVKRALSSRYEIIEEIGRGGMAIVYKAIQKNLDRIVALKALPPQFTLDKEFLERFHREARSAARVHHLNIITIYDEGIESGVHYISMEFLEGTDLHKLIRQRGRLTVEESVQILAPIAEALAYAHKNGLVHRDVKSSNIFITRENRSVLTDFGIARAAMGTQLTRTGAVIGTPEFMSPEQAAGMGIDGRSDLYSLGVVLYHALTGHFPYTGDSPQTVIYKILNEPYIPPRKLVNIPAWADSVIEQCLDKDVNRRVQSGAELADKLRRKVSIGKPSESMAPTVEAGKNHVLHISAVSGSKLGRLTRGTGLRSRWRMIYVVAFFLVIGVGAVGYFLWQRSSQQTVHVVMEPERKTNAVAPKGQEPQPIRLIKAPNLVGMSSEEAIAALQKENLKVGTISKVYSSPANRNKVVKQIPKENAELEPMTPVNLFVGE